MFSLPHLHTLPPDAIHSPPPQHPPQHPPHTPYQPPNRRPAAMAFRRRDSSSSHHPILSTVASSRSFRTDASRITALSVGSAACHLAGDPSLPSRGILQLRPLGATALERVHLTATTGPYLIISMQGTRVKTYPDCANGTSPRWGQAGEAGAESSEWLAPSFDFFVSTLDMQQQSVLFQVKNKKSPSPSSGSLLLGSANVTLLSLLCSRPRTLMIPLRRPRGARGGRGAGPAGAVAMHASFRSLFEGPPSTVGSRFSAGRRTVREDDPYRSIREPCSRQAEDEVRPPSWRVRDYTSRRPTSLPSPEVPSYIDVSDDDEDFDEDLAKESCYSRVQETARRRWHRPTSDLRGDQEHARARGGTETTEERREAGPPPLHRRRGNRIFRASPLSRCLPPMYGPIENARERGASFRLPPPSRGSPTRMFGTSAAGSTSGRSSSSSLSSSSEPPDSYPGTHTCYQDCDSFLYDRECVNLLERVLNGEEEEKKKVVEEERGGGGGGGRGGGGDGGEIRAAAPKWK